MKTINNHSSLLLLYMKNFKTPFNYDKHVSWVFLWHGWATPKWILCYSTKSGKKVEFFRIFLFFDFRSKNLKLSLFWCTFQVSSSDFNLHNIRQLSCDFSASRRSIICRSKLTLRQIIDQRDTGKWQYFALSDFHYCHSIARFCFHI